jgi:hypothetical protein
MTVDLDAVELLAQQYRKLIQISHPRKSALPVSQTLDDDDRA